MIEKHANWFDALQTVALFYPKLAAAMSAAAIENTMRSLDQLMNNSAELKTATVRRLGVTPVPAVKLRSTAPRKASNGATRKKSKRSHSRRKVA